METITKMSIIAKVNGVLNSSQNNLHARQTSVKTDHNVRFLSGMHTSAAEYCCQSIGGAVCPYLKLLLTVNHE